MNPEKNDVDVSKLFSWGKAFEIVGNDNVVTVVFMRVLGDADINKARVHALRESAKLRRELRNPDSDEHLVAIKDIEDVTEDDLINLITLFSSRYITQNMWKNVKITYPKQPKTDAPLEELEKFQKEVDEYPSKREAAIKEAVEQEVIKLSKELKKKSKNELYKQYVSALTDELCEQKVLQAFREISTYLGCYKDDEYTERFFSSFDEFLNLETAQKMEFIGAYQTLEMSTEEIKKLREAMQ